MVICHFRMSDESAMGNWDSNRLGAASTECAAVFRSRGWGERQHGSVRRSEGTVWDDRSFG